MALVNPSHKPDQSISAKKVLIPSHIATNIGSILGHKA